MRPVYIQFKRNVSWDEMHQCTLVLCKGYQADQIIHRVQYDKDQARYLYGLEVTY